MSLCWVILFLVAVGQKTGCVPLESFYPFGVEAGDASNAHTLDGSSGEIGLNFTFPFFGAEHTTVYVSRLCIYIAHVECSVCKSTAHSHTIKWMEDSHNNMFSNKRLRCWLCYNITIRILLWGEASFLQYRSTSSLVVTVSVFYRAYDVTVITSLACNILKFWQSKWPGYLYIAGSYWPIR